MVNELTGDTFQDAIKGDTPVVVDFWADWCGPCKMLAPIFDELEGEFEGKLNFAKINIDQFSDIAREHGVMSIPCLVVFSKGEEVDRIVGLSPKPDMKRMLEEAVGKVQ